MQIYIVGGYARDLLMHQPSADMDYVVVNASSTDLISKGFKQVGKDFL